MNETLEQRYQRLCRTPGDINEHLPRLRALVEELGPDAHVTEFGTREAISTTALLAGNPRKLLCYDLYRGAGVDALVATNGRSSDSFLFHRQDVLKADIEETDLLFIDTWHVYTQLMEEFRLHARKVRKYIVLHDTTAYGETGEAPGHKGLWPAIERLVATGRWSVKARYENNNGLTVLERTSPTATALKTVEVHPEALLIAKKDSAYRSWLQDPPPREMAGRKMQFIGRCTPIRKHGMVSAWWARAVEAVLWPMSVGKGIFQWRDIVGGEIAEARNALVQEAMDFESRSEIHEMSHLLWIDDDVLVMRGALQQLLKHDRDIVSGTYFSKVPDPGSQPLIFPLKDHGPCNFIPDRAFEVWGHGMGLTLIKLSVYKRMRDELNLPPDRYGRPQWYKTTLDRDDGLLQEEDGTIHTGTTEDFWFLENAHRLGIVPLVDTSKHAFGFHFDPLSENGYPEAQWKTYLAGQAITWPTANGEVVWD